MLLARRDDFRNTQTLREHTLSVKERCEQYGSSTGVSKIAGLSGLLHDFGKANPLWGKYFWDDSRKEKMDHATWGAKFLCDRYYITNHPDKFYRVCRKFIVEVIANVICGHHSQLMDFIDLDGESPFIKRLLKEEIKDIERLIPSFEKEIISLTELDDYVHGATLEYIEIFKKVRDNITAQGIGKKNACFSPLFAHHIYSILVDADRTDAREWQERQNKQESRSMPSLKEPDFLEMLEKRLKGFVKTLNDNSEPNKINLLRQRISDDCFNAGKNFNPGVYRLATPVGAGKTIASLRFAMEHAKEYGKERIVYVLPFTAIIEQNAEEVRKILKGKDWLLEHHGQVVLEKDREDSPYSLSIAKDNWDAPIIFTTMYQYLMAFYGGSGKYLRKLHHLTNSIVIFDEVQSVPPNSISLFNESVNYLNEVGNTTVLLCTATQPTLNRVAHDIRSEIKPIVKEEMTLARSFKRVDIENVEHPMNTRTLTAFAREQLNDYDSILVILNTKQVVRDLYKELLNQTEGVPIYHLSTNMCPKHRTTILDEVKSRLERKEKVICVSTALIEAGVDISFQAIIRSLAGLDSVAQASGRCNRHGKLAMGKMYLVNHKEEKLEKLPTIQKGKYVTSDMLELIRQKKEKWSGDLISPEGMTYYFQKYFEKLTVEMNYPTTTTDGRTIKLYSLLLQNEDKKPAYCPPQNLPPLINPNQFTNVLYGSRYPLLLDSAYRTVFDYYKVYDSEQTSVIVPYDKGREWIQQISNKTFPPSWEKEIQPFTINLFEATLDRLIKKGLIYGVEIQKDQFVYILKESAYDKDYGCLDE